MKKSNQIVFAVLHHYHYDCTDLEGIFSTLKLAKNYVVKELIPSKRSSKYYENEWGWSGPSSQIRIEDFEIDKVPELFRNTNKND